MRRAGFFDRRVRGFRIVELGAMAVLAALVVLVYLAKDGAGDKRADIDRVQQEIVAEQEHIRLLKAEVAHQEQPERLEALAGQYLGLHPIAAKHEVDAGELADVVRVATQASPSALNSPGASVTPGLVPAGQDHHRNLSSAPGSASPSGFLGPRDKPGGDEVKSGGAIGHAAQTPPPVLSAH